MEEKILKEYYSNEICSIELVKDENEITSFKLTCKEGITHAMSLDAVVDNSDLSDDNKERVRNDLNLNAAFFD